MTDSEEPLVPPNKSHVVIFEGELISEFVNSAVVKQRAPICQLKSGNCSVYDLPDTSILVVVSQEKNLNLFGPITELLGQFLLGASKVTTITILPSAMHKRIEIDSADDPICYLRSLNGTVQNIEALTDPNMITGVAAGVSIWRQFKGLSSANNYIAFMEAVVYDSCSTKPLIELLHKLDIPCEGSYKRRFKAESNLYL